MKGLDLSELYYRELCAPMLERSFPDLAGRVAAGLAGEGSECLGFDDEVSRDHDWGAAVCLWLLERDFAESGQALQDALRRLPRTVRGHPVREEEGRAAGRSGVLEIGRFYFRHLGLRQAPDTPSQWLAIPEERLATATSGAVFADPAGEFTRIREQLLAYYPEDVRRKKLAARCAAMAQAGQYNFPRCAARREYVAASLAEAAFVTAACSAAFLLNRRYKPFYKWAHRALLGLPVLGPQLHAALAALAATPGDPAQAARDKAERIEGICATVAGELVRQGLSDAQGDFLMEHGLSVQNGIRDVAIRNIDVLLG